MFDNDILASLDLPLLVPASVEEAEKVKKRTQNVRYEGPSYPWGARGVKLFQDIYLTNLKILTRNMSKHKCK